MRISDNQNTYLFQQQMMAADLVGIPSATHLNTNPTIQQRIYFCNYPMSPAMATTQSMGG